MDESKAIKEAPLLIGPVKAPRQFVQLGLLVVDGSHSMTDKIAGNIQKAQATDIAVRELFTRFKTSRVAKNFAFAMITFDEQVTVRLKPMQITQEFEEDKGDYNPLAGHGGGTNIYAALEQAESIANEFIAQAPAGGVPHSVVILVMSDGCCSDPAKTKAVAKRIKNGAYGPKITICCAFFGTQGEQDKEGEDLLRSIASDPVNGFKTVYDGETLRNFFTKSMSSASGGIEIR
jgi:Mg-chelatase subunit ChlD